MAPRRLQRPMFGDDVRAWQQFLSQQGLLPAGEDDGVFGAKTEAATMAFQRQQDLEGDGIVGTDTRAAMQRLGGGNFYQLVIKSDPRFDSKDRVADIELLEPITRMKVLAIIADAKASGLELMVFETYRSQKRQEQLFQQGATKLRKVGTHHYGIACDIVKNVGGEPSWKGDFSLLGQLARQHGLIWGGDWGKPDVHNDFPDLVHVQRATLERQPDLFREQWYPDQMYDPFVDG